MCVRTASADASVLRSSLQCNCPITDIQIVEHTLASMAKRPWADAYKDLEDQVGASRDQPGQSSTRRDLTGIRMAKGNPLSDRLPASLFTGRVQSHRVAVKGEALNKSPPSGIMNNIIKFVVL